MEERPGEIYPGMANLEIKVNALDPAIKTRIIITDPVNGKILINDSEFNPSQPYRVKVKTGSLHIYVIGNEPDRLNTLFDEVQHENKIRTLTLLRNELPSEELSSDPAEETNLPLMKFIPVIVKVENDDPETGMISSDGGNSWSKDLNVVLERLAVKASLKIRKNTDPETDEITVLKVSMTNIPVYSYWYARAYPGSDFMPPELAYNDDTGITLTNNADVQQDDNYETVFEGFILPEYIAAIPTDENTAVSMQVYMLYNQERNVIHIPLRTFPDAETFSLERNTEHIINATLTKKGELIISPEVKYEVKEWGDAGTKIEDGSVITFDAYWGANTQIDGKNVFVASDKSLEFKFKLVHPAGSTWKATLTNPLYFEFDYTDGAASAGLGGIDIERTIRIKPRKGVSATHIKSDFYITIDCGGEYVELDLPNERVGAGNRYSINLIPD